MSIMESAKSVGRKIRRFLKLSPMFKVLRGLKRRGIEIENLQALEIFGGTGEYHVKDYAPYVSTLEVWEYNSECENSLKRNLPMAKVKITDSFKEIKITPGKYNFILVDCVGHYGIFPDVFRIAMDPTVMVITVIPQITQRTRKRFPHQATDEQMASRCKFYKTDRPENISFDEIAKTYEELCRANGFDVEWHFIVRRNRGYAYYFVLRIKKRIG
jgi:hypothetical protein